jgi:hypothetical protein
MKKKESATAADRPKADQPFAKRNDPDYEQVSAFLPKKLNAEVIVRLRRQGKKRGFSDLLEQLLSDWLKR